MNQEGTILTKIPHLLWKLRLIIQKVLLLGPIQSQLKRVDCQYASKILTWILNEKTFNSAFPVKRYSHFFQCSKDVYKILVQKSERKRPIYLGEIITNIL